MTQVHLDFETRSLLSVSDVGGWVYAAHPTTDIICAAYAVDDEPVVSIKRDTFGLYDVAGLGQLEALYAFAEDPEVIFCAHNAGFEINMWRLMVRKYGAPPIDPKRWRCTAAKAAFMSLPRKLEQVLEVLKAPFQKDMVGNKSMLKLSRPRRGKKYADDVVFWEPEDASEDFEKTYAYNITDVEGERWLDNTLPDLNPREQRLWHLDQEINTRGLYLDVPTINQILKFIDITVSQLSEEFNTITGLNKPTQTAKLREWLLEKGFDFPNLQKATVDKAIKQTVLPDEIKRVLELRQYLSKASTAKYTAMLDRVDMTDNRLREMFLIYAAITKRWGGRGVQLQNLPRGTVKSDTCIDIISYDDYAMFCGFYPDQMAAYSSSIRGAITASPDHSLYVGDFNAIEARVLAWLAGQQDVLEVFINDQDPYCEEATKIYNELVTKKDFFKRLIGKVSILALGYQGGIGAFSSMAKNYNLHNIQEAYNAIWPYASEDEQRKARASYNRYLARHEREAEDGDEPYDRASGYAADIIKQRWREKNNLIVRYWNDIERAAIAAVLTGEKQFVGNIGFDDNGPGINRPLITFGMYGEHLLCKLPSGNCLVYPFAQVSQEETPFGGKKYTLSYKAQNEKNYQYGRTWTYGGKLVENITQSIARDCLADALLRVDEAGYYIVGHVHDEIIGDIPIGFGSIEEYESLMSVVPDWAEGLPIKVEVWNGHRYKKG